MAFRLSSFCSLTKIANIWIWHENCMDSLFNLTKQSFLYFKYFFLYRNLQTDELFWFIKIRWNPFLVLWNIKTIHNSFVPNTWHYIVVIEKEQNIFFLRIWSLIVDWARMIRNNAPKREGSKMRIRAFPVSKFWFTKLICLKLFLFGKRAKKMHFFQIFKAN